NDYWIAQTVANLATGSGEVWRERPYRIGLSGLRVVALADELEANAANYTGEPDVILVHIGTNDQSGGTAETPFKADLRRVINALLARFPGNPMYINFPYRADVATPTSPATMKTWITAVIAEY